MRVLLLVRVGSRRTGRRTMQESWIRSTWCRMYTLNIEGILCALKSPWNDVYIYAQLMSPPADQNL